MEHQINCSSPSCLTPDAVLGTTNNQDDTTKYLCTACALIKAQQDQQAEEAKAKRQAALEKLLDSM